MFAFFFILVLLLSVVLVIQDILSPVQNESQKFKRTNVVLDVIVCCGLLLLMVLRTSYADSSKSFLIPCISICYCLFRILVTIATKTLNSFTSLILTIAIAMITTWISTPEVYTHNVNGEYTISITNSIANIDSDITLPKEVTLLIEEEAENMKKFGANYYEGKISLVYECNTPKYANEHGKTCTCSSTEICTICSKYVTVSDVKLSKKLN